LKPASASQDEAVPSKEKDQSKPESEEEGAARERKERVASIPVMSRVVTPLKLPADSQNRNVTIGCLVAVAIFIAFAMFCCSAGGGDGADGGMYEECVRQRKAAGLDTSPCSEWAK
jgi:hypothetical protein